MTTIDRASTVGAIVLSHPECARVFEGYRIDFCCGGRVSVPDAAKAKGLDPDAVFQALERAVEDRRGDRPRTDYRAMSTPGLVAHIIDRHHGYLREAMPPISRMMAKVARVHGDKDASLVALDAEVQSLLGTLGPHLDDEETALFPALLAASAPRGPRPSPDAFASMHEEHLAVGASLERVRSLARDFAPPDWACTTYRTLLAELAALEADIHQHVHLENNLLAARFQG